MLKKVLLSVVAVLFLVGGVAGAEEVKSIKGGFFYDLNDCKIQPIANATLFSKWGLNFDIFGKREDNKENTAFGEVFGIAITYDLLSLAKWIDVPDNIDLSVGYAISAHQLFNRDAEFHHGIKADIVKLQIKF